MLLILPNLLLTTDIGAQSEGASLLREPAPSYPIFRRPGSAPKSQLLVTPELFETYERSPRFSYPVIPFAVRAFLFHSQQPVSQLLRESRFGFPCGLPLRSPCGSRLRCSSKFRCRSSSEPPFPILIQSPFFSLLAGPASGSPGRPFRGALTNSASGPPAALVYSLLLEDRSSVELKDTLDCPENKGV